MRWVDGEGVDGGGQDVRSQALRIRSVGEVGGRIAVGRRLWFSDVRLRIWVSVRKARCRRDKGYAHGVYRGRSLQVLSCCAACCVENDIWRG